MHLFALKDTQTDQWYTRGAWSNKPRVWREKGPMKLALIYLCDVKRIPHIELKTGPTWRQDRRENNAIRVSQLPDTFEIWQYTEAGLLCLGKAAEWYRV